MATVSSNGGAVNSPSSQFIGSLNDDQKTKFQKGQQDAKALNNAFSSDADGAKKQQKFADAMKEGNPIKKMMMLHDFEKSLNPDEKKALDTMKDDSKDFQGSLNKDQKNQEHDIGKKIAGDGKATVGGVFDLSS